jgi:hypothetical protein
VGILFDYMNGWPNVMSWKGKYDEWIRLRNKDLIIILEGDNKDFFRDNRPKPEVKDLQREWRLLGIRNCILARPGIELYFPRNIVEEVHKITLPLDFEIDIERPLHPQLKELRDGGKLVGTLLSTENFKRKNKEVAERLRLDHIKGTDLESFLTHDLKMLMDSIA